MERLFAVVSEQRKLESVLCRIERDCPRTGRTVQAVCRLALDAREIDWIIKRADHTVVASIVEERG